MSDELLESPRMARPGCYVKVLNDNGRRTLMRALRLNTALVTRRSWLALYEVDNCSLAQRQAFLQAGRSEDALAVKAYVVYCHPNPDSFTAALRDRAVDALRAAGHEVRMSDLYADGFEPALSRANGSTTSRPQHPHPEIDAYCENLRWCDALGVRVSDVVEWTTGDVDRMARPRAGTRRRMGVAGWRDADHRSTHQREPIGDHHQSRVVEVGQPPRRRDGTAGDRSFGSGAVSQVRPDAHGSRSTTSTAARSRSAKPFSIESSNGCDDCGSLLRGLPVEGGDNLDVMSLRKQIEHRRLCVLVALRRGTDQHRERVTPDHN